MAIAATAITLLEKKIGLNSEVESKAIMRRGRKTREGKRGYGLSTFYTF